MKKLVFVYNADSGVAAALFDSAHKLLSPQTYQCNLCALTHGLAAPKKQWSEFLKTLPEAPEFLHRDEFLKSHPEFSTIPLPAIFRANDSPTLHCVADGAELASLASLDDLIALTRHAQG